MIDKSTRVLCNPHATRDFAPVIRTEALNGFSVKHGNIAGTWLPTIGDAVADYNNTVGRRIAGLRLQHAEPETMPLCSLPGWEEAEKAELARMVKAESEKAREAARTATQAKEAQDAADPRRKRSKGLPFGLLGLLAMAATLGAFDDDEEDEDTPTVEIHHAEIADILAECGLFHRTGAMSGVVAIPRKLGAAFIERLEKAIRANDVEAVRLICAGVKV